jgi:hypothetical protein
MAQEWNPRIEAIRSNIARELESNPASRTFTDETAPFSVFRGDRDRRLPATTGTCRRGGTAPQGG